MARFPTLTDTSERGNETLYIAPVVSPDFPIARAIPSVFSSWALPCAKAGLASNVRPNRTPDMSLGDVISASLACRHRLWRLPTLIEPPAACASSKRGEEGH